ncbi:AbrB family transcriptional regulator [Marinivivus vitaminiproducens]|uniref:AbrB family transcriptional regulator n=1 Tax=Marinivivus vitaminiproducens TaxID=3035935 RepID=UPI0027A2E826|nr:AbrB family transcriptional regulator [Geminicoccaceae bacterium SCSIO 64248]
MTQARVLLTTAVLAVAGGSLLTLLGAPVSWLCGAMVATGIAALLRIDVHVPSGLAKAAFVMIGVSMGASVTPETIEQIVTWPLSLAILAVSIAAIIAASAFYLEKVHGWDKATARFSSIPGALNVTMIVAADSTANLPQVAVAQSIRLFVLVAIMPTLLQLGSAMPDAPGVAARAGAVDIALMLAAGTGVGWLLERVGVPAGMMLGAMIGSAALHVTETVHGLLPVPVMTAGFLVTGAVIGVRFRGANASILMATLPGAIGGVILALALSAGFAGLASYALGIPFGQLWLAYAPGGVDAMAAMALALDLAPAFVGAHHVIRFFTLSMMSPFWLRGVRLDQGESPIERPAE